MSNPHEQSPGLEPVILLGDNGLPVEAPADYELNEAEKAVLNGLIVDIGKLFTGESDGIVVFCQKDAYSIADETIREILVGTVGQMIGIDLDSLLASTEEQASVTIGAGDRAELGLNPKEGATDVTQRYIKLELASKSAPDQDSNIFHIYEFEFQSADALVDGTTIERWKRVLSVSKALPQPEVITYAVPQDCPGI